MKKVMEATAQSVSLLDRVRRAIGRSKEVSVLDLTDKLNCGASKIKEALDKLREQGLMITVKGERVEVGNEPASSDTWTKIDVATFAGKQIAWGVCGDTHLCSRYARLDVLNALFDIWEQERITEVYVLGNIIEGEARFNKHDLLTPPGVQSQVAYLLENWPKRKGMTTKFITGDDHEGWYSQSVGVDVGRMIMFQAGEIGRDDLIYLGHMEHDIELLGKAGSSIVRLVHPGGGTAYATSYQPERTVDSYQGGEKPNVCLFGHWHKFEMNYRREVWSVSVGCVQDQTPFMRKKKLQAHVGGCTIRFDLDEAGLLHRFRPEFHPFYDRDFYEKGWRYKWHG